MYLVHVIIDHGEKEVFKMSESFPDDVDRDYIRAFLSHVGNNIESHNFQFDDDFDDDDFDDDDV